MASPAGVVADQGAFSFTNIDEAVQRLSGYTRSSDIRISVAFVDFEIILSAISACHSALCNAGDRFVVAVSIGKSF